VAVVTSIQFSDLPAGTASFGGKRSEEGSRRICFRNAGYECSGHAGLAIGGKGEWFFKATQTEIAQPGPHEITRLTWL